VSVEWGSDQCLKMMKRKREEGMSYRAISKYVAEEWEFDISHNAIRQILIGKRKLN
jgi:intein-encoded DNA endonuclease-like protein